MDTYKEIKENLETVLDIKNIAATYQDVANLRMNQIREKVFKNREFFDKLLDTYQKVRLSYTLSGQKEKFKKEKTVFRKTEKDKIIIFLSANQFFYGSLIYNIWQNVQKYIKEEKTDLVIIGKTGKYLAEKSGFGHKIIYFDLNDVKPEQQRIEEIIELIKKYKKIIVFHGEYEKALTQNSIMNEISGELTFKKIGSSKIIESYILEPSVEAVLDFFEKEIIAVLFNQTILEHQLARYASRVMAMHQANENANKIKEKLLKMKNRFEKNKANKKQIELISSAYGKI